MDDSELARAKRLVKYPKAHNQQRQQGQDQEEEQASNQEITPGAVAMNPNGRQQFPHEKFGGSQVQSRVNQDTIHATPGSVPSTLHSRGLTKRGLAASNNSTTSNAGGLRSSGSNERQPFPHAKFGTTAPIPAVVREPEIDTAPEQGTIASTSSLGVTTPVQPQPGTTSTQTDPASQEPETPRVVEAMLVTQDSIRDTNNADNNAVLAEAEILIERSFWYKCAPKSKWGQCFCVLSLLGFIGVASTGIVCGSGLCSPTNDGNNRSDFDPDAVIYNPDFIRLPNYTIDSLKNSSSPQARAYRWMEENAEVYEPSTRVEWRKHQLFGMATLFYAMDGESWDDRQFWLQPPATECNWMLYSDPDTKPIGCIGWPDSHCQDEEVEMLVAHDLPCDYGVLTSLNLSYLPIGNTIPPEIELLSSLQDLSITGNPNLRYASHTKVDFILPSQIGNLQALTNLRLQDNFLEGRIPTSVGRVSTLTSLRIQFGNEVTGRIPSEMVFPGSFLQFTHW